MTLPATNSTKSSKPEKPLLRLCKVGKTYHTGEVDVPVLHDVDFELRRGEMLVIVGPSGSGKSTLLNLLGGIDTPSCGEIWFGERNIANYRESELTEYRRRYVGFIFQFYNLVPTLTARENVLVSTEISECVLDADESLRLVEMQHRSDHFPAQMSGGEQQRIAIARAVAKNPQLLLCDEPTGALDLETGRHVLSVLTRLNQELGTTIVIITHNSAIAELADRKVRIGLGTITAVSENAHPTPAAELTW